MNKRLFFFAVLITLTFISLGSCSSAKKCPDAALFNPVYEKDSCKVRTRNVYVADLISPELKGKFRDNPATTVQWVNTVTENGTIIPGHFIILNASGSTAR